VGKKKELLNEQLHLANKKCHVVPSKPRSGRPMVSPQTGVQCSTHTVCGRLLDHGLRSYRAVKKPLINDRQKIAWHRWTKRTLLTFSSYLRECTLIPHCSNF
uniref:Transposase Tc1-like domain-containing protein n=1 Tax=Amphiprion percula TaxID=161767 RepID=A0A3P8SCT0_AMPPE